MRSPLPSQNSMTAAIVLRRIQQVRFFIQGKSEVVTVRTIKTYSRGVGQFHTSYPHRQVEVIGQRCALPSMP